MSSRHRHNRETPMTVNKQLLEKALAAGAKLTDAERQVELARTEYHAIVRRMHLAGGSLREIAHSLELSHQRVQQMVDNAGGRLEPPVWGARNGNRKLTFTLCARPARQ